MSAAKHLSIRLDTVADDAAAAIFACGREPVNGAFEAVENVGFVIHDDCERLIVDVPAGMAFRHDRVLQIRLSSCLLVALQRLRR